MMNLLGRPDIETGEVYANFNQNVTALAVATRNGYSLYSLSSVDLTLGKLYSCDTDEIFLIERLFESSLVAIVSQRSPRKLKVCDFKKQSEICNYSYSNTILSVKLNRQRLVVCLEESLYIHNIQDMKVVHTIRDTPCNGSGLCALSSSSEHCYLAYPGSITSGEVQIFDAINLHAKTMIPAHDSPLAAMAFSPSGTEIATASERGTVIRVFSSLDGSKLFELRRGLKRCVSIASLSFSTCSGYLVSSSNTETVHIFRLDRTVAEQAESKQSSDDWMGYLSKTVTSYLPTQVTDVFTQGRAFTSVSLPEPGIRRICAITTIQKQLSDLKSLCRICCYCCCNRKNIPKIVSRECPWPDLPPVNSSTPKPLGYVCQISSWQLHFLRMCLCACVNLNSDNGTATPYTSCMKNTNKSKNAVDAQTHCLLKQCFERLLVASQDGYLYVYSIPSIEGAECQLIKKHDIRIDDSYAMDIKVDSPQPLGGSGVVAAVTELAAEEDSSIQNATASGATYASAVKGEEKVAQP